MDSPNPPLLDQVGLVHAMRPNRTGRYDLPKLVNFTLRCKKDVLSRTALNNIKFSWSLGKTPMKTLEMLSKVYCKSTTRRDPRFANGIGVLKRAKNPLKTMHVGGPSTSRNGKYCFGV
ncbi:hypothetical protein TNCV_535321 [Trichonephila clavipes]|nr:hypothetical protein TNCV_535321 [Trichonephila clavipes]